MTIKLFRSLRYKIIFLVITILLFGMFLNTSLGISLFRKYYSESLKDKAFAIGSNFRADLESIVNLGVQINKIAEFDVQCKELIEQNPILAYVIVTDTQGVVIYSNDPAKKGVKLQSPIDQKASQATTNLAQIQLLKKVSYYDFTLPVFNDKKARLGEVRIGFPVSLIDDKVKSIIAAKIALAVIVSLAALGILILLLTIWVGKPISIIISKMRKISLKTGDDITQSTRIASKDEIEELGLVFNKMIEDLEKTTVSRDELAEEVEERKCTEEELKIAYDSLQQAQNQLIQTAKMASIGQLAAGMAHEINNPLTGVINNVQLIKMMASQSPDSTISLVEFKDLLDAVEKAGLRCKKITQSLLDFSHASKVVNKSLSINEIVNQTVELINNELKLQNINIQLSLEPSLPFIEGNPQLLQQVFMNLITNAQWAIQKKANTSGGLITIKTGFNKENNQINVDVVDTGIGISPEVLGRIFEPFFTTKDVGEGTGLGLSVLFGIIKDHRGTIKVESQVGQGSTFKISLPVFREG